MVKLSIPIITANLPTEQSLHIVQEKDLNECITEAIEAMAHHDLHVQHIKIGVGIVRFAINKKDKDGWYVFNYQDGVLFGAFGNHKISGVDQINFTSKSYKQLSPMQQHEINLKIEEQRKESERLKIEGYEAVAVEAQQIIVRESLNQYHQYALNKGVSLYQDLRVFDNTLFVPLYDTQGKIWNAQKIYYDNEGNCQKRYISGGRKQGLFYPFWGEVDTVLICEGYATGATLASCTGKMVICAMDSHNVVNIVNELRQWFHTKQSKIIICADHDYSDKPDIQSKIDNTLAEWRKIAEVIVAPRGVVSGYDFNDYQRDGGNVKDWVLPPVKDKKSRIYCVQDLIMDTTPPDFLLHGIIPRESLGMIHGASGHKKTFLALHMAYHIACGLDWAGRKVKSDNDKSVIYLAGEGKHGIKFRFRGLWQKHKRDMHNLFAHDGAFNLNTIDGYIEARDIIKTIINDTGKAPSVIFIDTLHRFLEGDENSSKDAKTMIDACDKIKQEFNCAVILVHHTGLNADDRARGSSSWKASMDFEFNVKSVGNTTTMYCKKMKDAEEPQPIVFNANVIKLDGINHENGEAVTTVVLELSDNQEPPKPRDKDNENKVKFDTNDLKACWKHYRSVDGSRAYVSYKQLKDYAMEYMDKTETEAKNMTRIEPNRFIGRLIEAKVIEKIPKDNQPCYFFLDPAANFALIHGNYDNCYNDEDVPF